MKFLSLFLLSSLLFMSCQPQRNLVYFSDASSNSAVSSKIMNKGENKIQQNDVLNITVSSLSAESNALFNGINTLEAKDGYRVDKSGNVNIPLAGSIKLDGLTISQAEDKVAGELNRFIKNPIVNVHFLNFKVTVIGEVNRPSSFTIQNDQINLLEALGMAGDMTAFGKRENVLVIREVNGERSMMRLNLNKHDILNSPYYYLKQNDVVYVEPDKAKASLVNSNNKALPIIAASVSVIAVLVRAFIQ